MTIQHFSITRHEGWVLYDVTSRCWLSQRLSGTFSGSPGKVQWRHFKWNYSSARHYNRLENVADATLFLMSYSSRNHSLGRNSLDPLRRSKSQEMLLVAVDLGCSEATFSPMRVSLEFRPNLEIEKEKLSPQSSVENPDLVFRTFPDSREFCCVQNCIYICTLNPFRRHLNHNKAGKLKVDILLQRNYSVKWVKTIAIR